MCARVLYQTYIDVWPWVDWHACASINLTRVICVSVTVHLYRDRLLISADAGRDVAEQGLLGYCAILYDNEAWLIDRGFIRITPINGQIPAVIVKLRRFVQFILRITCLKGSRCNFV